MAFSAQDLLVPAVTAVGGIAATMFAGRAKQRHDRRARLEELLARYRDPLLGAAFELQSRLYNIARDGFLATYYLEGTVQERTYACESTLWLVGQYLGWIEIMRREIQFLDLGNVARNRGWQEKLDRVTRELATNRHEDARLRLFRSEQRAIGELMIKVEGEGRTSCHGYAEFPALRRKPAAKPYFARLAGDVDEIAERRQAPDRIVALQRALVDLVDHLDPQQLRYPSRDGRGKLPPQGPHRAGDARERVARFHFLPRDGNAVQMLTAWAGDRGFVVQRCGEGTIAVRRITTWRTLVVELVERDSHVMLAAFTAWRWAGMSGVRRPVEPAGRIAVPGDRRARRLVNSLLQVFDRPQIVAVRGRRVSR